MRDTCDIPFRENELITHALTYSAPSLLNWLSDDGMLPVKSLPAIYLNYKWTTKICRENPSGQTKVRSKTYISVRFRSWPMEGGIVPLSLLFSKLKNLSETSSPIDAGIVPVNPFDVRALA
jgi:hypothetical protein